MKRELFQNVLVSPYTSGDTIERQNFLSCVFGAAVTAAGKLTLTVTHSDDGSTFEAATDMRLEANDKGTFTTGGVINVDVEAGDTVNVDIDLVGSKQYIAIAVSGAAAAGATIAYVLGDLRYAPA